ncbi:hypothetical protein HG15A2_44880 [Adhaeretor mobilis]|uniref:Uncharacterized protein n=2 Tax=Adhaeretor mobilis TaxID=1930276 RepID=A0A517N1X9_9BACT|nr:hypothetical protein HG15A2_44880 [Adhaeretor mobilis]
MTFCHEVGHLIGGWLGGGTLSEYSLAPWHLPYSFHSPDPFPQLTLWAGPLFGVALPLTLALIARHRWGMVRCGFLSLGKWQLSRTRMALRRSLSRHATDARCRSGPVLDCPILSLDYFTGVHSFSSRRYRGSPTLAAVICYNAPCT